MVEKSCASFREKKTTAKSMVEQKEEAKQLLRYRRLAHHDATRLGQCIQLVDVMLVSQLVKIAVKSAEELHSRLGTSMKLFTLSATFNPECSLALFKQSARFLNGLGTNAGGAGGGGHNHSQVSHFAVKSTS